MRSDQYAFSIQLEATLLPSDILLIAEYVQQGVLGTKQALQHGPLPLCQLTSETYFAGLNELRRLLERLNGPYQLLCNHQLVDIGLIEQLRQRLADMTLASIR